MVTFVDTSALYALLSASDMNHEWAEAQWLQWVGDSAELILSNYILLETTALVRRRLGMQALRQFYDLLLPVMDTYWVSEEMHQKGMRLLFVSDQRQLSLVDCVSFVVMAELGVTTAFTFDQHFAQAGFTVLPAR